MSKTESAGATEVAVTEDKREGYLVRVGDVTLGRVRHVGVRWVPSYSTAVSREWKERVSGPLHGNGTYTREQTIAHMIQIGQALGMVPAGVALPEPRAPRGRRPADDDEEGGKLPKAS